VLWEPLPAYRLQPASELIARAGVLTLVVQRSFGMPDDRAKTWIEENGLTAALAPEETALLAGKGMPEEFRTQVEALWALAWVLGLSDHLDPSEYCGDTLAGSMPDLRKAESLSEWVARADLALRDANETAEMLDLHYCLTWGLADANLNHRAVPGSVEQYVLWERRRALEFALVLGDEPYQHADWYEISLDT
jgi:hypothetical protein